MATFAPPSQAFTSPKRKRDVESVQMGSRPPKALPRLATDLNEQSSLGPSDTGSPRSVVAGHFEQLELEDQWARQLSYQDAGRGPKRFAQMTPETSLCEDLSQDGERGREQSMNSMHGPSPLAQQTSLLSLSSESFDPTGSTTISKPRARSRSPPLDGDPNDNPFTWHESEITGHNPTDPTDDGYGINGIGFRPTPAMAWARSQKRKQQIADYRSREAREARQRRSERRRNASGDSPTELDDDSKLSKVRFIEPFTGQV